MFPLILTFKFDFILYVLVNSGISFYLILGSFFTFGGPNWLILGLGFISYSVILLCAVFLFPVGGGLQEVVYIMKNLSPNRNHRCLCLRLVNFVQVVYQYISRFSKLILEQLYYIASYLFTRFLKFSVLHADFLEVTNSNAEIGVWEKDKTTLNFIYDMNKLGLTWAMLSEALAVFSPSRIISKTA